jgi:hypothetical protein
MAIHLTQSEIEFIESAGLEKIKEAAYHFVRTKLVKCEAIPNKGHPVFKAMKAIGAGDAKSLERNFEVPCDKKPNENQVDMLVENIMGWIRGEVQGSGKTQARIREF